jgi:hypothetical protein
MAFEHFFTWSRNRAVVTRAAQAVIAALLIGYAADIAILIRNLMVDPSWGSVVIP